MHMQVCVTRARVVRASVYARRTRESGYCYARCLLCLRASSLVDLDARATRATLDGQQKRGRFRSSLAKGTDLRETRAFGTDGRILDVPGINDRGVQGRVFRILRNSRDSEDGYLCDIFYERRAPPSANNKFRKGGKGLSLSLSLRYLANGEKKKFRSRFSRGARSLEKRLFREVRGIRGIIERHRAHAHSCRVRRGDRGCHVLTIIFGR